jgi:hypothetical protein
VRNVSAISWQEQVTFQWDDDVHFVFDQHDQSLNPLSTAMEAVTLISKIYNRCPKSAGSVAFSKHITHYGP